MKTALKHITRRRTKGARLGWASLKEKAEVNVAITSDMVNGRRISEEEIRTKQNNHKISLLVP